MIESKEFRIRVCKDLLHKSAYVSSITSSDVTIAYLGEAGEILAFPTRYAANKALKRIQAFYPSAEVETHYLN